jgi:hypothetical protein
MARVVSKYLVPGRDVTACQKGRRRRRRRRKKMAGGKPI